MAKSQRIRDPLHDLVQFEGDTFHHALWKVVCSRPFQRLRRVKQLGFSELVYPGATHTRFAHSLGVYHTARLLMEKIHEHLGDDYNPHKADYAIAAALVHDVGHGPFSHAFEKVGKRFGWAMAKHENLSVALIKEGEIAEILNSEFDAGGADNVSERIKGATDIYGAVVSSQFDADRLDYMRRDRLMTGSQHSAIDFKWLLENIEIGEVPTGSGDKQAGSVETFVLGKKARFAAEAYVLSLFQLYPTVYFHKATRSAEVLCQELLARIFEHVLDGAINLTDATGLPSHHPLLLFPTDPGNVERLLELDDTVVWGALSMMTTATDKFIASAAKRLLDRNLFKAIDVLQIAEAHANQDFEPEENKSEFIERIRASVKVKVTDFLDDNENLKTRILIDEGVRDPYSKFDDDKGPLNQIMIRIEGDRHNLADLGKYSDVVKALRPFRFFRIYVADEDEEAKEAVNGLIQGEMEQPNDRYSEKHPAEGR